MSDIVTIPDLSGSGNPGAYDRVSGLIYPNYFDRAAVQAITGWTSADGFTVDELGDASTGEYSLYLNYYCSAPGTPPEQFQHGLYPAAQVFTEQELIQILDIIKRPPDLRYDGPSTLAESDLTPVNGDPSQVYYDAPFTAYPGKQYETTGTTRWFFPVGGPYETVTRTLSYTETRTSVQRAGTLDVEIDYRAQGVTPYDNKVWGVYSTDEFRMDGTEVSGQSENNTHPAGTIALNYRAAPSFSEKTADLYTGTPATYFDVVPQIGDAFDVPANDSPYMSNYGNLLTPQQEWGIGGWVFTNSATSSPFCKGGSTGNEITRVIISSTGLVRAQIGGLYTDLVTVDPAVPHFIYYQHYNNGVDWVIDVYLDGAFLLQDSNVNIGTTTNNLAPLIMGVWAVSSQVDPATDAQNHPAGGWVGVVHVSDRKLEEIELNGLYYRNKEYYLHGINGDSMTENLYQGNTTWAVKFKTENDKFKYRASVVNIAVAGRKLTQMGVESPTDGFDVTPPFIDGGDTRLPPVTTQSAEFLLNTFDPDIVLYMATVNDGMVDYYDKNPNAIEEWTNPDNIGVNGYTDERLYETFKLINFWNNAGVQMWHSTGTPVYDTVSLRTQDPNVTWQDAQGIANDELVAYAAAGNIENLVDIFAQLANPGTYVPNPDFYNNPLTDVHINQNALDNVVEPSFRALTDQTMLVSRDRDFDPIVVPVNLSDGQTVYTNTVDFVWSHDGVEVTEQITLTEGSNTVARTYENTAGRTGSFSIDVTYEAYTVPSVCHLKMDVIVQDGADFKFLDSDNNYDALVFGDRTITNGAWVCTQTGGDYAYIPTSVGQDWFEPLVSEFSASIVCTPSALANNRVFGVHPVSNSFANGLSLVSNQLRYKHGGNTTSFGEFPSVDTEYHWGIVARFVDPGWEVDLYVDGVIANTITITGTNYDSASPAIISGSFLNDSDFTAGADENVDGSLRNFRYYEQAVASGDWLKIAAIDTM